METPHSTSSRFSANELIPIVLPIVFQEQKSLAEQRHHNQTFAIVIVGAIIGFAIKEESGGIAATLAIVAAALTMVFWYQDYRLHRLRHGWHGMGHRLRAYIRGEADELVLLKYEKKDEDDATFYCKSSGLTFVALAGGALLLFIYRFAG